MPVDNVPVVIVGAGPSGLALGIALAQHQVHSVILEKGVGISEDPRGVFLAGDAIRILYQLGIGDKMEKIGHEVPKVNFHKSNFAKDPFFAYTTGQDFLKQVVPDGILQIQPELESSLRNVIEKSSFCSISEGCEVVARVDVDDGYIVEYENHGFTEHIRCNWLVGADGKKGVVRKQFLEKPAGIIQAPGLMEYEGCWIAANLKLHPPTTESHPDFPLWKLGYTPEQVYDLFWPQGWHFCCPPGIPSATGRFGPYEKRLWRHEFPKEDWDDSMDAEALFWDQLTPQITRTHGAAREAFPHPVTFPRDCINILRCRPFNFVQKVVNKWHHERTVLIGDAAHVFPPFGGQGIACGVRDAHTLAWRLAVMTASPYMDPAARERFLDSWAKERRQGIDDATRLTMLNGSLCNEPETWKFYIGRNIMWVLEMLSLSPKVMAAQAITERQGYSPTKEGFFAPKYRGGYKAAQIYLRTSDGEIVLSDGVLNNVPSTLALLVISEDGQAQMKKLTTVLQTAGIPRAIVSDQSIIMLDVRPDRETDHGDARGYKQSIYTIPSKSELGGLTTRGIYDPGSLVDSIGTSTRYALVRPDFHVYASANDLHELQDCLRLLRKHIH